MIVSHIVAASKNNVIGVDGDLPWHIPEDFKFFKDKTNGHILIMGRKTLESLPGGKPLPNRLHIVITRQNDYVADNTIIVNSIEQAIEEAKKHTDKYGEEVFIAGGGEIYKQSLPFTNRIYLTRICMEVEGDTLYPEVDESLFSLTEESKRTQPVEFSFLTYDKA